MAFTRTLPRNAGQGYRGTSRRVIAERKKRVVVAPTLMGEMAMTDNPAYVARNLDDLPKILAEIPVKAYLHLANQVAKTGQSRPARIPERSLAAKLARFCIEWPPLGGHGYGDYRKCVNTSTSLV